MKQIAGPLYKFNRFEKYLTKQGIKKVRLPQEFALMNGGHFIPIKDYEANVLQTMAGTKVFDELVNHLRGLDSR